MSFSTKKPSGRLPVIIGVARTTIKNFDGKPTSALVDVLRQSLQDAVVNCSAPNAMQVIEESITDVVTIRMAVEDGFRPNSNCEPYKNLAQQVSKMAGVANENQRYYATSSGGSTPQVLMNMYSEKIARGEAECIAMIGGEFLEAFLKQTRAAKALPDWGAKYEEDLVTKPVEGVLAKYSGDTNGVTNIEKINNLTRPAQMYPLLEQAYRAESKSTLQANIKRNGQVFEKFNHVAATQESKLAWFPKRRSADEIASESPSNRWISFPYTKYMNAVMQVNQAASIILVSEEFADKLGVPKDRRVYLRGCAEAVEPGYFVSVRPRLGTSYAMTECLQSALKQAKVEAKDISLFDLYSCFPVAVNVACDALGINPLTDPRPLTVTGGLPYYGGPGNAYVSCSIAAMVEQLRKRPAGQLGLVNANGWFLTKHACGVYSREPPPSGVFEREDPKLCQARADKRAGPLVAVAEKPNGKGWIEAYIVDFFSVKGEPFVRAVGRVVDGPDAGKRFIGTLSPGQDVSVWMKKDGIGMVVDVTTTAEGKSFFAVQDSKLWATQPDSGVPVRPEVASARANL